MIALFVGNVGIKPVTTPADAPLRDPHGDARLDRSPRPPAWSGWPSCRPTTPLPLLLALLALSGVFRSVGFTAYNSVAFADVEPARMTARQHADVDAAGARRRARRRGRGAAGAARRAGGRRVGLGHGADEPFRVAFVLLAVVLVGPVIEGLLLSRAAGDEVTGRA